MRRSWLRRNRLTTTLPALLITLGRVVRKCPIEPLDALLQSADVISLHVPLLPSTTGLIGSRELALMKPGSVLIQAARGGVVD